MKAKPMVKNIATFMNNAVMNQKIVKASRKRKTHVLIGKTRDSTRSCTDKPSYYGRQKNRWDIILTGT